MTSDPHPAPSGRALWFALAASALVLVAGIVDHGGFTWGIHSLGRLGIPGSVIGITVILLGFAAGLYRGSWPAPSRTSHPAAAATLAALIFGLVSWSLRVATQLLGDGQLIVRDFQLAREGSRDVIVHSVTSILRFDSISPLTSMLHLAATRVGSRLGVPDAATSLALESILLGSILVALLIMARRKIPAPLGDWMVVLTLLSPSILLYFGYAENYTAAHLALGIYAMLAVGVVAGSVHPAIATAALVLATGLHVQALIWWPSAVFLWMIRSSRTRALAVRILPWIAVAGSLVLALAAAKWWPQRVLMTHSTDSLWSLRHALDLLQGLWLVVPLLPLAFWLRFRHGPRGLGVESPVRQLFALADLLVMLTIVYLFVIDPVLGAARDWDRAAFLTWALALQILVALHAGHERGDFGLRDLRRWLAPATAIGLVATGSWILLNHSEPRSVSRIESVVMADPHAYQHGFEALTRYHSDRDDWANAAFWAQEAYEASGNPRLAALAAQHLRRAGRPAEGQELLEHALARHPRSHRVRHELLRLVAQGGDSERTLVLALEGARRHPDESIYPFFAGDCLAQMGHYEEAEVQLSRCLEMDNLPAASRRYAEDLLARIRDLSL